jgi:Xaa-Pro aminopeptidase
MTRLRFARPLLLGAMMASSVFAGEWQDDLKARRARLMEKLGPDALLVVWSAPTRLYSLDVDYEYRQDSNLLYLTGIDQEDAILVLMPGNKTKKEILFTRPGDPRHEHRQGHILTKEEVTAQSGIATVHNTPEFEAFASAIFAQRPYGMPRRPKTGEYDAFFEALRKGRARLHLPLTPPRLSDPLETSFLFAGKVRERYFGVTVEDASPLVDGLRQVKTPFEQKVLRRSVEISSAAHRAGMRAARPGGHEYEVEAAMEQVYLANGAMSPGYPSIVGSGPNATILHYSDSSRRMDAGDLLLVDAAANYQGLTGDITRTYPVGGRFSEAQKDIYRIVLEAQEAGMKAARVGGKTDDVEQASEDVVKAGLLRLGLITDAKSEQFRTFYTHGICHWIGMDVHDVGDYNRPLEPGMAFVVEPGIYIREAALKELPETAENKAFVEKVRPVVARYKDIGVRVEDSFLLTDAGLERLSATVPRTIEEVEGFLRR